MKHFARNFTILLVSMMFCLSGFTQTDNSIDTSNEAKKTLTKSQIKKKRTALLKYLKDISASDKYLCGQRYHPYDKNWDYIKNKTGRLPAIMCIEYCKYEGNAKLAIGDNPVNWESVNKLAIEHWNNKGLIRIICHFPNPYNKNYGGLRSKLDDNAKKLLSADDSEEKQRWLAMIDEVSNGILDLNKNGVIPIFGPMHEMNGKWFWWGANLTPEAQRGLWNQLYTHMREKKCAVLWLNALSPNPIYNPDGPPTKQMNIIGIDAYGYQNAMDLSCAKQNYYAAEEYGKLFTVSEFGSCAPVDPTKDPNYRKYHLSELVKQMDINCPRAYGVVFWSGPWGMQDNNGLEEFMSNPRILKLGDVDYPNR